MLLLHQELQVSQKLMASNAYSDMPFQQATHAKKNVCSHEGSFIEDMAHRRMKAVLLKKQ